ncbi:histidine kinase [Hydrogenophaga sp.]|uniref:sensor histidine kinase n=1 Tax=Hydrogenophaga sp. TaxID=1904254 RepID=UPI00263A0D69|nr:histidine kinase [Hydrogenophaga sp.]
MPPFNPAFIARRAFGAVVFNTVIALAITAVMGERFAINLVYSQCIGLGIWALIDGGRHVLHPSGWPGVAPMAVLVVGAVLASYPGGVMLANLLLGRELLTGLSNFPRATIGFVLMSLAAGGFGAYYFTSSAMLAGARLAREEALRQASEARLKLLESQLEPHMLFNTLANLRALIGTDPDRATAMLDRLNDFLRATLAASRTEATAGRHTLQAEFDRLRDYLELMAVRMGPRLRYRLDLPEALASQPVPPLLLQPLVENCIRHGLEPSREGGEVRVMARRGAGVQDLELEVSDTGVGCAPSPTPGFGLTQVRERLATAYPGRAALDWQASPGGGTRALLTLPLHTPATTP